MADRGHVRGMAPFYMNGSTETAAGPYTVTDVDWQGQTTARGTYTSAPTWATVLTGDGYTAYASSTATSRRALAEMSYDDLGRPFRTDEYGIAISNGAKQKSLRTDMFYDRNSRVVASGDLGGGTSIEIAYDGAGRQDQSRTVFELEATKYSSGAFNYRAPTPHPTRSSMTGGDDKVLTLSHSVFDAAGNVTEQHAYDMNHTDGISGMDLTNNDDYVRRSVYSWYDDADRLTATGDYGSGDTTAGASQWKYAAVPARPGTAPGSSSDGNRRLKDVLLGAAKSAIAQADNSFADKFLFWRDVQGLHPANAKRNVARALAATMWSLWKSGQTYEPRRVAAGAGRPAMT